MAFEAPAEERILIVSKLHSTTNPSFGFASVVGEMIDGRLVSVTPDNFCKTMKVFITDRFEEIDRIYPHYVLFKMKAIPNARRQKEEDCNYVSNFAKSEAMKPKELFEVIHTTLPDANDRVVTLKGQLPGTHYVFVNDGEDLYGPFKWEKTEDIDRIELKFLDARLPGVNLTRFQTYKVAAKKAASFFTVSSSGEAKTFLSGPDMLEVLNGANFLDYASDMEVVMSCMDALKGFGVRTIDKAKAETLVAQLGKMPGLASAKITVDRLARLPGIISQITDIQDALDCGIGQSLSSEIGKKILAEHINANQDRLLEQLKRERQSEIKASIQDLLDEQAKARERLSELNMEKLKANDKLQEVRDTIREATEASSASVIMEQAEAAASETLEKAKAELADIQQQIKDKQVELGPISALVDIKKEMVRQEANYDFLTKKKGELEAACRQLENELNQSDEDIRRRYITTKPLVEAINGLVPNQHVVNDRRVVVAAKPYTTEDSLLAKQRTVIAALSSRFSRSDRYLPDHDLANLLISTQQSFITVFAGLPGAGKSTLGRLLATVQDIHPRLQEVQVSRGWTSQKDLVGYFNPLANRVQPASTGVYDYLRALQEAGGPSEPMAYMMLDEANLSPMEHYWSAFMDMCDGKPNPKLTLGMETLPIPGNLRFLATINYDGTTEPLSQRLIDRATIIVLESDGRNLSGPVTLAQSDIEFPLPLHQMNELFGNTDTLPPLDPEEADALQSIKAVLGKQDIAFGKPIIVSHRKEMAIKQYCNKARALMGMDNDGMALDYAVLQHVLPLVNGNGTPFKQRLEALKAELIRLELPKSQAYLERMIAFGSQDLHHYDFFCW